MPPAFEVGENLDSVCFASAWLQHAAFEGPFVSHLATLGTPRFGNHDRNAEQTLRPGAPFFHLWWHVVHWLHRAPLNPHLIYICIFILNEIRNPAVLVDKYLGEYFSVSLCNSLYIQYICMYIYYILYFMYIITKTHAHAYVHIQTHTSTSASNKLLVYI